MKEFLDIFSGIITQPSLTLGQIARKRNVGSIILLYLLVLFFSFAAEMMTSKMELAHLLLGLPFVFLVALVFLFLHTAILQLAADFLGGKGKGVELFIALILANIPSIFAAPLALFKLVDNNLLTVLSGLGSFLLAIWILVLNILAIREVEGFSTGKAAFVLFLPWLCLIGSFVVFIALIAFLSAFLLPLVDWQQFFTNMY